MNWKWLTKVKFFFLVVSFSLVAVAIRKIMHNDNRDVVYLKKKVLCGGLYSTCIKHGEILVWFLMNCVFCLHSYSGFLGSFDGIGSDESVRERNVMRI